MRLKVCTDCGNLFEPTARARRCGECSRPDPRWSREYKRARAARIRFVEIDRGRLECESCGAYLVPLQAHHVDGQRDHHTVDNLRMLCCTGAGNCHQVETDKLAGRHTFVNPPSQRVSPALLDSEQGAGPGLESRATKPHPAAGRPMRLA